MTDPPRSALRRNGSLKWSESVPQLGQGTLYPALYRLVLSLAVGIGANAVILGVVYAVLFTDSPLAPPETLVNVYETESGEGFNPVSHANIEDLRKGTTA